MNSESEWREDPSRSVFVPSLLALGAGVVWSLGALAARLADQADAWQYLLWRSLGIMIVIELRTRYRQRARGDVARSGIRAAFTSGWVMIAASACLALASVGFIYALKHTTAANAAFLASLAPLLVAVLARVVLGERLNARTVGAIVLGFCGLAFMVNGELGVGNINGNIAAMLAAFGFAGYAVCARSDPLIDWSPALPGSSLLMIPLVATVCLAQANSLVPPATDVALALFHGGGIIVVGMLTFNAATRHLPAVASIVFAQTETVFVPVWIFLWFAERPKNSTLIGGAIILAAVVGKALLDARAGKSANRNSDTHELILAR